VSWAGRLEELGVLRSGMRERLKASALMDEVGFVRGLEAAYRRMWVKWCERQAGSGERA